MNPNLFQSTEFYRRRYQNFATLLIYPLLLLVGFLVIFSLIAKKEISISTVGEITPTSVIASIQSTSDNPLSSHQLKENKVVKKDDLLLSYSETMDESQKTALETQLANAKRQKIGLETLKASLKQGVNFFIDDGVDEFGHLNTYQSFMLKVKELEPKMTPSQPYANQSYPNQIPQQDAEIPSQEPQVPSLPNNQPDITTGIEGQVPQTPSVQSPQGAMSTTSSANLTPLNLTTNKSVKTDTTTDGLMLTENAFSNSQSQIDILRTEYIQKTDDQLTTITNQIAELEGKLQQADVQVQNNTIKAPQDGIVHLLKSLSKTSIIPKGTEIAQILPDMNQTKKVMITYYVNSNDIATIKRGQTVRLRLDKISSQDIVLLGKVKAIDASSTETKEGNLFKVKAQVTISEADSRILKYGMQGRVTSIIGKKTFFNYYKDKMLNDMQ
ncbi:HlyD family efflux transporter periplasmic adaptor subunit [Streptococcus pluranimalium]|uniref:HlyD family efflux transporter periplasmic adaptor subunit n=1 Tax=Streptococcus pluranimalium TaxID=82348 RepID=UPI003F691E1B